MKNTSSTNHRLRALDGLRGIAILLVFLNHVSPVYIIKSFPILDRIGLFSGGIFGVSFLFILSGFLMTVLYPNPSNGLAFIQKRYTRIFPLFLTMCTTLFIVSTIPRPSLLTPLLILCTAALVTHSVWVYGIKKIHSLSVSRALFIIFMSLQVFVGMMYAFWIMRHPPTILNSILPPYGKNLITGLVNATLTFPFGNYIPMLDGVYWSLAAEILFYILYPVLVVPIINFLTPTKRIIKYIFLFILMPLIVSIDVISHHILVLSAFQFSLFYYFVTGIALGYLYRTNNRLLNKIWNYFRSVNAVIPVILFICLLIAQHVADSFLPDAFSPFIRILFAIPVTLIAIIALDHTSMLARILESRLLVFFGLISYSIYLSHALVISFFQSIITSHNVIQNVTVIIGAFVCDVLIATALYFLLEKPYFIRTHTTRETRASPEPPQISKGKIALGVLMLICITSIVIAFHSTYNFFSRVDSYPRSALVIPNGPNSPIISMKQFKKVEFEITPKENNLGIVSLAVTHVAPVKKVNTPPLVTFSIREKSHSNVIFSSDYVFDEFKGKQFPFGFPTIAHSNGNTYVIDLSVPVKLSDDYISINTNSLQSVFKLDKKEVLMHPSMLSGLLENNITTLATNRQAITTLLLQLPFIMIALWLMIRYKITSL